MKIAMIGHKQIPSRSGGVEVAVEALASRMVERGHEVTVYNRGQNPEFSSHVYRGIQIRSVPVVKKQSIAAVMGSFFAAVHAIFRHYDCIHLHAEGPAAMAFLPRLFGIRTVVTIHGLDWQRSKWGRFASWYLKLGESIAARFADEIIVLSQATKQYFLDTYQRETVYIPNGFHPIQRRTAECIKDQWSLTRDSYLLYLGRIVPEKGLHYLIQSFRQTNTDKKLVIAGSPLDMPEYYRQVTQAAEGDPRIQFVGFVQGQVLEELFSNCYLYCLPSDLEGMPISLLEALGFGCCCLSSDIPECAEVLHGWGYQFCSGDTADLHTILQTLCKHPEQVKACRTKVHQQFVHLTWDEVTDRTLELYQKLPRS